MSTVSAQRSTRGPAPRRRARGPVSAPPRPRSPPSPAPPRPQRAAPPRAASVGRRGRGCPGRPGRRSLRLGPQPGRLGFGDVPLICARELEIAGSMPRVVRMMAHVETDLPRASVTHVYLHGAANLRRDLSRTTSHD